MPDKGRNSIESYAKMILRMTTPYSGSYYQQAKRLYPKIGRLNTFYWQSYSKLYSHAIIQMDLKKKTQGNLKRD